MRHWNRDNENNLFDYGETQRKRAVLAETEAAGLRDKVNELRERVRILEAALHESATILEGDCSPIGVIQALEVLNVAIAQ
jgi:hypothetical protein